MGKIVNVSNGSLHDGLPQATPPVEWLQKFGVTEAEWNQMRVLTTVEVHGVALDDAEVLRRTFEEQKHGPVGESVQKDIVIEVLSGLCMARHRLVAVDSLLAGKAWRKTAEISEMDARIAYILSEIPDQ
jgi:hypothetical protein